MLIYCTAVGMIHCCVVVQRAVLVILLISEAVLHPHQVVM